MPTLFHPATIRWGHRIIVLAALAGSLLLTASLAGAANDAEDNLARATFAGGCFWCMEPPYDEAVLQAEPSVGPLLASLALWLLLPAPVGKNVISPTSGFPFTT